jgi:hypothetical protein
VLPGVVPDTYGTANLQLTIEDQIFIQVMAGTNALYYKVDVHCYTPEISDITLGGRSASGGTQLNGIPIPKVGKGVGTPGDAWNAAGIVEGEIWFGTTQVGTNLALTVSPIGGAAYTTAVAANGNTEPVDFANNTAIPAVNGSYLYVKVQSPYEAYPDPSYYKIKLVQKGDDRAISGVTIGGKAVATGVMGTHSFPGSEAWGAYSNGAELAANNAGVASDVGAAGLASLQVNVATKPADLAVTYGWTITERDYTIEFQSSGVLTNVPSGAYIAIKVSTELGEEGWYKFRVYEKEIDSSLANLTMGGNPVTGLVAGVTGVVVKDSLASLGEVIAVPTSGEATVGYGLGPNVPTTWQTDGTALYGDTTPEGQVVYVRITAGETAFTSTYSFAVYTEAGIKATALRIGGTGSFDYKGNFSVTMTGPSTTNVGTAESSTTIPSGGTITINEGIAEGVGGGAGNVVYVTSTVGAGLTYRLAKTAGAAPADSAWQGPAGAIPPNFTAPIANNDVIWIEITAGSLKRYQKVTVTVTPFTLASARVSAIDIGGSFDAKGNFTPGTAVSDFGTPGEIAADADAGSVTLTAAVAGRASVSTTPTLVESAASYMIAKTTGEVPAEIDWQAPVTGATGTVAPTFTAIADGDVLWYKITLRSYIQIYKIVATVQ